MKDYENTIDAFLQQVLVNWYSETYFICSQYEDYDTNPYFATEYKLSGDEIIEKEITEQEFDCKIEKYELEKYWEKNWDK